MRKFALAAILLASLGLGGSAGADTGAGQCYAADGRPTGPAYELGQLDRDWVDYVIARGGHCTGMQAEPPAPSRFRFTEHETPNHRHLLRRQETRTDEP